MDDFTPDDFNSPDFGGGGERDEIYQFMLDITRGITAKIPENITEHVPKPSVKEVEAAAVYVARNNEKMLDGDIKNTDMFMNSSIILVRANIHDAVERGARILTEEDYNEFARKQAEQSYYASLNAKGHLDFTWSDDPDNPEVEMTLSESGRKEFARLWLDESTAKSYFCETLDELAGGKDAADKLVRDYIDEKTQKFLDDDSPGLGKLLRDVLNFNKDSSSSSSADKNFEEDPPF